MVSEDFLKDRAEKAVEQLSEGVDTENDGDKTVKVEKRNKFDEKLEKDLKTDEAVWSREEVEYLANNRHKMSNDEIKDFLNRNSDFQEDDFERFSEAEEELIMRNFPMQDVETLSEKLDRPENHVEKMVKMLGLGNKLE
jgi:hypothetical protein